jgi:DNA gyrase subunit A
VKTLSRGSKGGGVRSLAEGEKMREVVFASTTDYLLGITGEGRAYRLLVDDLPEKKLKEKGLGIRHIIDREEVSEIALFVPYPKEEWQKYLFLVTAMGKVKRINYGEVENITRAGKAVATIGEGYELVAGFWAGDEGDVFIVSSAGYCVRFPVEEVRVFGRGASGVYGMRVKKGRVVAADFLRGDEELLVITEYGYGKRVHSSEFRRTHRGTMGLKGYNVNPRVGVVVAVHVLREAKELVVVTERGKVLRVEVASISQQKRYSSGVRIINLDEGDRVSSSTVF